ncbi:glycoside hydrolase family 18 protein [Vallitalea guaymasensis]|uniref:glycoside hydrolase family 18 protein n=1 Tax=Vallitalea guaymasensis TaxID=1185412 RepID=UPI0023569EBA|nr:glycosyl hydrolase family 18 protein [Vallitalea guaymasensis]
MTHINLIGYVSIKDLKRFKEEDIKKSEVINLAFAKISEGKVVCDILSYIPYLEKARAINPDIRFVLSIGGWGAGGFSIASKTVESRKILIKSAIDLIEEAGLDGIDIDWEYPCISVAGIDAAKEDKENFTHLIKEFRMYLDERGMEDALLTIAAAGDEYFIKCTEMDKIHPYLDYVQLMTYDLRGGFTVVTGHHANLYSYQEDLSRASADKAVRKYMKAGVPANKLVVGAAFYSRMWEGVPDVQHGFMQMAKTTGGYGPSFHDLLEGYIDKNGFVRYWDTEAKAPYLFNGDCFISYEDQDSLFHKIDYIQKQGLYGLMYWEYGTDRSGTLLRFIDQERKKISINNGGES